MPCSRSHLIAPASSPLDSARAFLHSIIGKPVFSRSDLTQQR